MNDYKINKKLKVTTNILLVILIVGAMKIFFDDKHTNDHIGWLILIAFWVIRCVYGFVSNLQEGKKKFALADLILVILGLYLFSSYGIKYLT